MNDKWYRVNCAKVWGKVVLFQGKRLLDAHETMKAEMEEWFGPQKPHSIDPRYKIHAEEYFFITAVRQFERWLAVAVRVDPTLQNSLDQFRQDLPTFKEIRNMREHEDEYLDGEGRQQAEFACTTNVGEMTARVEASATLVVGEKFTRRTTRRASNNCQC